MKKILIPLALGFISLTIQAEDSSFNPTTGIVQLPVVRVNNVPTYANVELKIRTDGLFELVKASDYQGISSFTLKYGGVLYRLPHQYGDGRTSNSPSAIGKILTTTNGTSIIITGFYGDAVYAGGSKGITFQKTPEKFLKLPLGNQGGKKGAYYYLSRARGNVVYADLF